MGHRHAFRHRRARRAPTATISGMSRMSRRPRAATRPTANCSLHTDSAEIVGLLCMRDAKEGGLSIYSSSLKVHEIIEREHPEYLPVLERGFRCDRRGEEAPEDDPVTPYRVPVFSTRDGFLSCRFVRGVIDKGAERLGERTVGARAGGARLLRGGRARGTMSGSRSCCGRARRRSSTITRSCTPAPALSIATSRRRSGCCTGSGSKAEPPRPMVPEVQLYRNRSGRMGVDPQPGRGPR